MLSYINCACHRLFSINHTAEDQSILEKENNKLSRPIKYDDVMVLGHFRISYISLAIPTILLPARD
jgi:hypothetical protein